MRFFPFDHEESKDPKTYCDKWRKMIEIDWFSIEVIQQYHPRNGDKWRTNHTGGYGIALWKWNWGSSHMYYDGPHCSFSIGFICIWWANPDCKKCLSGM